MGKSPFQWIKTRPSRQVGAIGEQLVRHWCVAKGFEVSRSPNSEADMVISGHRVEVKYSSPWTDNNIYKFQQIRDQDYDYCFCMGVSPFDVHAWFIPKSELMVNRPPHLGPNTVAKPDVTRSGYRSLLTIRRTGCYRTVGLWLVFMN